MNPGKSEVTEIEPIKKAVLVEELLMVINKLIKTVQFESFCEINNVGSYALH